MECLGYQGRHDNAMPFYFWFSSWIQLCVTLKRDSCALKAVLGRCCPSQGYRPVLEDKEKQNCLTKGKKFHFPCACFPRSAVTGLSGTKYIPNTCWNKQHTRLSSDGCSIRSCRSWMSLHFIYLFFGYSNAKPKSQGRHGDLWHSGRHWIKKKPHPKMCCFHSQSDSCSLSLPLADLIFWAHELFWWLINILIVNNHFGVKAMFSSYWILSNDSCCLSGSTENSVTAQTNPIRLLILWRMMI